ncbi:annexin D5-like [Rhododendron vialii]|uniref:annexin D5-like n=1 Tax=Rhododendron vialii TaxID=182163 RepID=UPI00265EC803|nr:annexin D5-like [Rhododendron vialii]
MSTMSDHPKVTSEVTEGVPPNATTLSSTSVPHESIVESDESVHTESTKGGPSEVTNKPTEGVVPPDVITKAGDDAIHLNRAFAGWGCDEATIVNILARAKPETHRTLIKQEYKNKFSEDFDDRLSKELMCSADLKRALLLWMDDSASRDAKLVKHGLSKNLNVAIEVICSCTPSQLEGLKKAYRTMFTTYLDEDIESHTHDDNKKLLVAYAGAIRSQSPEVDAVMVEKDAKDLFKDGEWRLGTNEETFIRIFSERSSAHLAAINTAYRKMYVHSLKKAVKKETSSKFKCALLTILQCAENRRKYFAKALHKAMDGIGTDDETLTRIIVSRAEVDIEDIKAEYLKKYEKSLSDDVHEDTSGQYRAFLISLLNPMPRV